VKQLLFVLLVLLLLRFAGAENLSLQNGLVLFKQGQYEKALGEFQQAQIAQPANASIKNLLGVTETKLGRIDEANSYYQQAIHLDAKLPGPHKNLGVNYLSSHQYGLAEREFKAALDLSAQDPFPHYYLAALYLDTSRYQEAVEQLGPARPLLENDPELLFQMASACLRLDRRQEALTLIGDLEQRSVLDVAEEYQMGVMLSEKKIYPEAVERFRRITQMQPASWSGKFDLAIALINDLQPGEAAELLRELTVERPNDANLFTLLGSAYEASENAPKALDAYRAAVRADPENPDRYLDYTRLLMDLDRYGEAVQIVQQGMRNTPDAYALNLRLGSIQMMQGQYNQAGQSFQAAIQAQPEIALGYIALAQSDMRDGRDQDASQILATAREKLPPDSMLEYLYGLVLSHLSKTDEAIAAFQRSVALNPETSEPHYELGRLYFESGLMQPAKSEFERVLQLAPQHANAHYQLSRVYARLGDNADSRAMAEQTRQLLQKQREAALEAQKARFGDFLAVRVP
jgi:tetratricopeptide (TPR) repeat protein